MTVSVDCAKDATVTLLGNQNTYTLKGTCTSVTASATNNINVRGDRNTVKYKADKPGIANAGKGNTISQTK